MSWVRSSIAVDYRTLEKLVLGLDQIDFHSYAAAWTQLKFSYVHVGCRPEAPEQEVMLAELFEHVRVRTSAEHPINVRVCAALTLYSLYSTQICTPKLKVRIVHPLSLSFPQLDVR
jgi:hypothetical protein